MRDEAEGLPGGGREILPRVFEIRDFETLKTIADPLRVRIFEQLVVAPRTIKEVAGRLGLAPSRLYYHVSLLEEHGLVRVVAQRLVGNLVEKVYRAVADELDVAPSLLSFQTAAGKEGINTLLSSTLDATKEDLLRGLEARSYALASGATVRPRSTIVTRRVHRIPESKATELQARLLSLLDEFETAAVGEEWQVEETHTYAFTVAFYPHFNYPDGNTDE